MKPIHRKLPALLAAAAVLLGGCSGGGAGQEEIDRFLLREGALLTAGIHELADSEEYLSLMTGGTALDSIIAEISDTDFSNPAQVYLIELPDDHWLSVFEELSGGEEIAALSDQVREVVNSRLNSALFASMINGSYGAQTIAATTVLSYGKSYVMPKGWEHNALLLFECDGAYSSLVSFSRSGEGVISSFVNPLKNGENGAWNTLEAMIGDKDGALAYTVYSGADVAALAGNGT